MRIQLGVAGEHLPDAREVQRDPHHARDDDDLPGRRPGVGGLRELLPAADDRRPRRRVPAPERVVVLDVPVRRHRAVRVDVLHAAGGRLVLLRAAVAEGVHAVQRPGGVDLHGPPHRPVVDPRRDQLHRDDPQHARARHGLGPHAAVRVDDPDLRVPDHPGADVAGRHGHDAAAGPQLRDERSSIPTTAARRCCGSTCSGSSATPRSTSSCCPRSGSSPRSCRCSRASRSSATRRSRRPPPASPSSACSCGRTTCSRRR